jgi:hypothetical protein
MQIPPHNELLPLVLQRINAVRKLQGLPLLQTITGKATRDIFTPCPLALALGYSPTNLLMMWYDGVEVTTQAQANLILAAWPDCKVDPLRPHTERFPARGIYISTPPELRQAAYVIWNTGYEVAEKTVSVETVPAPELPKIETQPSLF